MALEHFQGGTVAAGAVDGQVQPGVLQPVAEGLK
jgi:hypothetical protein